MAMLGQLVRDAIEEVAFSGPPGINFSEVVEHVRARHTGKIDNSILGPTWAALSGRREVTLWLNGKKQSRKDFDVQSAFENKNLLIEVSNDFRNHILQLAPYPQICESHILCFLAWQIAKRRCNGIWAFELVKLVDENKTTKDIHFQQKKLMAAGCVVGILAQVPDNVREEYRKRTGEVCPKTNNILFLRRFLTDFDSMSEDVCQVVFATHVPSLAATLHQVLDGSGGVALESDCRAVIERRLLLTTGTRSKQTRVSGKLYRRVRRFLLDNGRIELVSVPNKGKLERALCTSNFKGDKEEVEE